jgi:hypothetical protein
MYDIPTVALHLGCGFDIDVTYQCPLEEERENTLAEAHQSALQKCCVAKKYDDYVMGVQKRTLY